MPKIKFIISIIVTTMIVAAQVGVVFAAHAQQDPDTIAGKVKSITLETNSSTGIATVQVTLVGASAGKQILRLSLETAIDLGLVVQDSNGNPVINPDALGQSIEIDPTTVIPDEEVVQHPVGSALAILFSDLLGIDYETIMASHEEGFGFGVIAQALWLTKELEGDSELFAAILEAKSSGDYSVFTLPDGTTPKNWGQLRKAILNNESLGVVMSELHNDHGQENGNGNGHSNGNGHGKDKERDKNGNGRGNNR